MNLFIFFAFIEKSNEQDTLKSSQSRINDSQPIYKALALHNFHAQTNR
jgi:hypothetical protein